MIEGDGDALVPATLLSGKDDKILIHFGHISSWGIGFERAG